MYTIAGVAGGIGTTARPVVSLYAPAGNGLRIRGIQVWNTTVTACVYKVQRLTNATGQGTGLTEVEINNSGSEGRDPTGTAFDTHSADTGLGAVIRYWPIGAAVGAGYYDTWGDNGLWVPAGTANGVGIVLASGTGQILAYAIDWEEV